MNSKYQLQHGLNYLMDHILYEIFKITLNISLKNFIITSLKSWLKKSALELCSTHNKGKSITDNPSIMIYVNKIEIELRLKLNRVLS